jgi:hypothetical protein
VSRGGRLALATCATVLLAGAFAPAGVEPGTIAIADAADGFVVIDEPDDEPAGETAPLTRLDATEVERRALLEPVVAQARRQRPGSSVRLRYLPGSHRWRVTVRDRGTSKSLALVEIDDVTGKVVRREQLPLAEYPSRSSERQAIDAAAADSRVRAKAKEWGGIDELRARGRLEGCCWEIDFHAPDRTDGDPNEPVIRVDVNDATRHVTGVWTGIQVAWSMARGDRDAFGGSVNERYVWLPLMLLFALVAIDWMRPRSWLTADVAALLALGVSHELFLQGRIVWSTPLALPPLLWLLGRMGWLFARGLPSQRAPIEPQRRLTRLALRPVPTMLLVVLCVALAGLRIGLTLDGGNVIDVGYAGVSGARLELDGKAPWDIMPQVVRHGDTYGPANYLGYVPLTAALDDPDDDHWGGDLPSATWTSVVADLLCALLLALIGWRWISRRGAALLAAGWLACPWTIWAMASGVNDALVALPLLAAFAVLPRATLRGLFVGVATMVKFAPLAALAPMLHVGAKHRARQTTLAIAGAAVAILAGLAWVTFRIDGAITHDLRLFWERTIGFQSGRGSPFSIWGLYEWDVAQHIAQVVVVLGLVVACVRPRVRDAWQVAAGGAAAIIAVQLVATHWFYLYIPWFLGFVLLVLVAARERPAPAARPDMLDA